jgi:hypothetical protein
MKIDTGWETTIALVGAAIAFVSMIATIALAIWAHRSQQHAGTAALRAQETANEIQRGMLEFHKKAYNQPRIESIFKRWQFAAKVAAAYMGHPGETSYEGRWKEADSAMDRLSHEVEWYLPELRERFAIFRERYGHARSLQEQKERSLAHGKLMELMKQIDGTRGYFVDEMNELPNVFAPLLGTQGDH